MWTRSSTTWVRLALQVGLAVIMTSGPLGFVALTASDHGRPIDGSNLLANPGPSVTPSNPVVSCGVTLTQSVNLTSDLGPCANGSSGDLAIGANSIVINCQGHNISGAAGDAGIAESASYGGATIENCNARNQYGGFWLSGSDNRLISDHAFDNTGYGFMIYGSGNTLNLDTAVGVAAGANHAGFLIGASNNSLTSDTARTNYGGGFLIMGSSNTLTLDSAILNGQNASGGAFAVRDGFTVSGTSNTLQSDTATGNLGNGFRFLTANNAFAGDRADYNQMYGYREPVGYTNSWSNDECTGNYAGGSSPSGLCTGYTVTFIENGLPPSVAWSVGTLGYLYSNTTIGGGGSSSGEISLPAALGLLPFAITPPTGFGVAKLTGSGQPNCTFALIGGPTTIIVRFGSLEVLSLNERGLRPGTPWTVHLASSHLYGGPSGQSRATTGVTISFTVVAGASYRFGVSTPSLYVWRATPHGGSIGIPSHSVSKTIRFNLLTTRIVFSEAGLPHRTNWSVTVAGTDYAGESWNVTLNKSTSSLVFRLPSGSYTYTVAPIAGKTPSSSGGEITVAYPSPQAFRIVWT
jgi:Right handed beta helix region